jgi:hypothetical protein
MLLHGVLSTKTVLNEDFGKKNTWSRPFLRDVTFLSTTPWKREGGWRWAFFLYEFLTSALFGAESGSRFGP